MPQQVHVVSHGPHCLDGVAAAVAVARYQEGRAQVVPHFAASRLVYDYLSRRLEAEGRAAPDFAKLAPLIAMADDNDRWLHRVPGSRELAWVVRSLGEEAYAELLAVDERVTYSPRMAAARARVEAEIAHSFAVANASRTERPLGQ